MPSSVVLYADLHMNSTMGLCKSGIQRDDGEQYQLNDIQRWLWEVWNKTNDRIDEITKDTERYNFFVGDTVDLDVKGLTDQVISHNPTTTLKLGTDTLEPIVEKGTNFFIRGTEQHGGTSGWAEEELARDLGAEKDPTTGSFSWWHWRGMIEKVKMDIAHTWNSGGLPWTRGNAAMKLAAQTIFEYVEWEEDPPSIVARAHAHRFADSGRTYKTRAIMLPCFQWKTSYSYKKSLQNSNMSIGAVVLKCIGNEYIFYDLRYQPRRAPLWSKQQMIST